MVTLFTTWWTAFTWIHITSLTHISLILKGFLKITSIILNHTPTHHSEGAPGFASVSHHKLHCTSELTNFLKCFNHWLFLNYDCTYQAFMNKLEVCFTAMRFAMMEFKVLIYQIILNFSIVKTEKTSDPLKLKPHNFKIKAMDGTWVKFQKRA